MVEFSSPWRRLFWVWRGRAIRICSLVIWEEMKCGAFVVQERGPWSWAWEEPLIGQLEGHCPSSTSIWGWHTPCSADTATHTRTPCERACLLRGQRNVSISDLDWHWWHRNGNHGMGWTAGDWTQQKQGASCRSLGTMALAPGCPADVHTKLGELPCWAEGERRNIQIDWAFIFHSSLKSSLFILGDTVSPITLKTKRCGEAEVEVLPPSERCSDYPGL